MTKFNVGDRVQLRENYGSHYVGDQGTVWGSAPEDAWTDELVQVTFDGSDRTTGIFAHRLKPVPVPVPAFHRFKVGDTVRYYFRDDTPEPGDGYKILEVIDNEEDKYRISWSKPDGQASGGVFSLKGESYRLVVEKPVKTRAQRQEDNLNALRQELDDQRYAVMADKDGYGYSDLRYTVLTGALNAIELATNSLREGK